MLAELNKRVFQRSASFPPSGWTEAQRRRQGCRSVAAKAEDACSRQGTTLRTAA